MKTETIKQKFDPDDKSREFAEYEVVGHCLVIRLHRELDHHCAIYVKERSDYLINKRHIKNIIFDFKYAHFMDSSGIGVIMGRYKSVIFTGGKVAVSNVDAAVDRIFELSGLYKIIGKYEKTEDAIRELKDTAY
ncbi:MAG: anti-sigma factor antagonist [bacterium]|nr:anti-sigma factor antagonist [bacterium]